MEYFSFIVVVVFFTFVYYVCKPEKKKSSLAGQKLVKSCVLLNSGTLLKSTTKTSNASVLSRGIVGVAVAGLPGALIGANGAKKHTITEEIDSGTRSFWVEYTDGSKAEEIVKTSSSRYQYLMSKLKV